MAQHRNKFSNRSSRCTIIIIIVIIIILVCYQTYGHTCHSLHVEITGRLCRADSILLSLHGFQESDSGLSGLKPYGKKKKKHLYLRSHLTGPNPHNFTRENSEVLLKDLIKGVLFEQKNKNIINRLQMNWLWPSLSHAFLKLEVTVTVGSRPALLMGELRTTFRSGFTFSPCFWGKDYLGLFLLFPLHNALNPISLTLCLYTPS